MNPQEELNQLLERQDALHQELKERKKELLEAQRARKETLKRQIRRAQISHHRRRTQAPHPPVDPHRLLQWSTSPATIPISEIAS